jgi:acyl-CoA reductase-like NAD-dependent aldehyde dehydrogenase
MKSVAPTVKPVSFELGGKNAAIVFADCNFDEAVNGLAEAVFLNTGKSACALSGFMWSGSFSALSWKR